MRIRRRYMACLGVGLLLVLAASAPAAAQCALCGQAAANASDDPAVASKTFEHAILVLLVPSLGLLGAVGFLLWRFRNDPGGGFHRSGEPEIRPAARPARQASVTPLRRRGRSR